MSGACVLDPKIFQAQQNVNDVSRDVMAVHTAPGRVKLFLALDGGTQLIHVQQDGQLELSAVFATFDGTFHLWEAEVDGAVTSVTIRDGQIVPAECVGGHWDWCRFSVQAALPDGGLKIVGAPGSHWHADGFPGQVWKLNADGNIDVFEADGVTKAVHPHCRPQINQVWMKAAESPFSVVVQEAKAFEGTFHLWESEVDGAVTSVTVRDGQIVPAECVGGHWDWCRFSVQAALPDGGLKIVGAPGSHWHADGFPGQVWKLNADGNIDVFEADGVTKAVHPHCRPQINQVWMKAAESPFSVVVQEAKAFEGTFHLWESEVDGAVTSVTVRDGQIVPAEC
eukprot:CAMPEP_0117459286 /NCGR_PEP_ID=MMETSP0784-20121206/1394_1 /TAXON_ID=39447 /ORGANISM="" /LENGTH=337 /DNA_ID=CAMNT_0005252883 /DNA_START=32 /DNA_END=1042 /DNA_ORIENTATION=-